MCGTPLDEAGDAEKGKLLGGGTGQVGIASGSGGVSCQVVIDKGGRTSNRRCRDLERGSTDLSEGLALIRVLE